MKKTFFVIILLALAFFHLPAKAADNDEVLEFFYQYVTLSTSFDVAVASLYADDARLRAYRRTAKGHQPLGEMTGVQLKEMIEKIMPMARDSGDVSKFSNVKISVEGDKVRIKADRYSVMKCFTDKGYYMVIKKDKNKEFKIIEEYVETQPQSDCEGAKVEDLQTMLQKAEGRIKSLLPLMVDADTRLDGVNVEESFFQYQYTLVNYTYDELDVNQINDAFLPLVTNQACTLPNLRPLIDKGATISFLYKGKNGKEVIALDVTSSDCK